MEFEWDEKKRLKNLETHEIDFEDIIPMFNGFTVEIVDDRFDYGETRHLTLGLVNGIVFVVISTIRGENSRIISARKATKYEEKSYFEEIAN